MHAHAGRHEMNWYWCYSKQAVAVASQNFTTTGTYNFNALVRSARAS